MITFKNSSPWANQYNFNTSQSGNITGWNNGTGLPAARSAFGVAVTKDKVFLLGGFLGTSSPVSSIITATINGSGVIETFSGYSESLPATIAYPCIAVVKDKVYVIGGQIDSADTCTDAIYSSTIDANGDLGEFSLVGTHPEYVKAMHAFIHNTRLYVVSESYVRSIPINSNGTLDFVIGWRMDTTLPEARPRGVCWWTGSRLYIWGNRNIPNSYCKFSIVDQYGSFGTWTNGPTVGTTLDYSECVISKNTVYLIGGYNGLSSSQVYAAPISNGVVGTWGTGTSFGANKDSFGALVTSSRIYLLGGKNAGTDQSGVRYGTFSGGFNDYTNQFYEAPNDGFVIPPKETIVAFAAPGKNASITVTAAKETVTATGSASDTRVTYSVAELEKWEMEATSGASLEDSFKMFDGYLTGVVTIHGDVFGSFELFQCDSTSGAALESNFEEWTADGTARVDIRADIEGNFELFEMTGELSWSINAHFDAAFAKFTCDGEISKKDANAISGAFELFTCSGEIYKTNVCSIDASFIPFSGTGQASLSIPSDLEATFENFTCFGDINKSTIFESIKYVR